MPQHLPPPSLYWPLGWALTVFLACAVPGRGAEPERVSFLNDVLPVLSKAGCNQGTCHGNASGKGGFKLSLRGFAPELDHATICREELGRRINRVRPEDSLLLLKPTLTVPHQGGQALLRNSAGYRIVLRWLRQGAPGPKADEAHVAGLEIRPDSIVLEAGDRVPLRVQARFSDGSRRDVTTWARFDVSDATVVGVEARGVVQAIAAGKAAVSAAYQDQVAGSRSPSRRRRSLWTMPRSLGPISSMPW